MDFSEARKELGVMGKMLDALEPLENDVARLRVLCSVAVMYGHYDMAQDLLNTLKDMPNEPRELPGPAPER